MTDNAIIIKVHELLKEHVTETRDYHQKGMKAMEKVDAMHLAQMQTAKYLANLEALPRIAEKIESIKSEMLPTALAQSHVPVATMNDALKTQARTYVVIIKALLSVIALLITVYVGVKYIVPDFFHR